MKTKLLKILSVFVAAALLIGCKGNTNTPEDPQTDESTIKSTSSVNGGGGIIIEAIMKDGTRQYYKVITPSEVGVTNYYAYYASDGFKEYDYKGNVVIPESITHEGTTYSVTHVLGGSASSASKCLTSAFFNCTDLKSVTLPRTINKIETCAMRLRKEYEPDKVISNDLVLICLATNPPALGQQELNVPQNPDWEWGWAYATIKVPSASVDAYKSADMWALYKDYIEAIE